MPVSVSEIKSAPRKEKRRLVNAHSWFHTGRQQQEKGLESARVIKHQPDRGKRDKNQEMTYLSGCYLHDSTD